MTGTEQIVHALRAIKNREFSELPSGDDPIAVALRDLAHSLTIEARESLDRTGRFSMNASDAMTAVAQMSSNLEETDNRTQTMAAAVEEMTASINQISEACNETNNLASSSNTAALEGVDSMNSVVEQMDRIFSVVEDVSKRTTLLSDASDQIAGILETIEAIAKQTNLLALNATIEAARAGERGKGFAVVAGEVKTLANQTASATEDIRNRIDVLTREIGSLLTSVSSVSKEVEDGKGAVHQTGEGIRGISGNISEVNSRMEQIAAMLTEQTKAVSEIASGVANVAELSGHNRKRTTATIQSVGATEALIEEQFAKLDAMNIPDYILFRAKSDHFIWKKRLAEMFVGLNNLKEEELADHHQCRLGKWYDQVSDPWFTENSDFKALVDPHSRVHHLGREAARMHTLGNNEDAERLFNEMEQASLEVTALLDKLIAQRAQA
jgi:methyl-accepting chemotaxis protein